MYQDQAMWRRQKNITIKKTRKRKISSMIKPSSDSSPISVSNSPEFGMEEYLGYDSKLE